MKICRITISTPLGQMIACATDIGVCLLEFDNRKNIQKQLDAILSQSSNVIDGQRNTHLDQLETQLSEYFSRKRETFTVSLDIIGTDFQQKVWKQLLDIPYGKTLSYSQQAAAIGNPSSVRAVANANAMNKIAIVVPCHRVIGSNGKPTGYAGGLDRKRWLLSFEKPEECLF